MMQPLVGSHEEFVAFLDLPADVQFRIPTPRVSENAIASSSVGWFYSNYYDSDSCSGDNIVESIGIIANTCIDLYSSSSTVYSMRIVCGTSE
jgi:hypothetical protein